MIRFNVQKKVCNSDAELLFLNAANKRNTKLRWLLRCVIPLGLESATGTFIRHRRNCPRFVEHYSFNEVQDKQGRSEVCDLEWRPFHHLGEEDAAFL